MLDFLLSEILNWFSRYYWLDYISFILGIIGTILLTKKNEFWFLFTASSVALASIVAIIAQQYWFLIANWLSFFLLIRWFIVWKKENKITI